MLDVLPVNAAVLGNEILDLAQDDLTTCEVILPLKDVRTVASPQRLQLGADETAPDVAELTLYEVCDNLLDRSFRRRCSSRLHFSRHACYEGP